MCGIIAYVGRKIVQPLLIEGDRIRALGPSGELLSRYQSEENLDARAQLVMPGGICAHTHFYGAFARGMAIPGDAPKNFKEILERLWWPLDKSLDEEAILRDSPVFELLCKETCEDSNS